MEITQEQKVFFLQVMRAFLSIYYKRDLRTSEGVGNILRWTNFSLTANQEACTYDPAMWDDWLEAIETVKKAAEEGRLDTAV